jgi:ribonuclease HII
MGFKIVAGVDEVGLGPLAGPVVAGAAVLPIGARLPGLDDSKKLTHAQRLSLDRRIRRHAVAVAVGQVDAPEFNRVGMTRARQLAMERAVAALGIPVEYLLLDAFDVPESPLPQLAVVKGDRTCASIMAASVVAKVHRDLQMIEFDGMYPGYGFALHKGYATAAHQEAIRFLGPSAIHRTSWRRVRELAAGGPVAEVVEVDEIANPSPRGGGGGKGFARPALGGFPPSLERAR